MNILSDRQLLFPEGLFSPKGINFLHFGFFILIACGIGMVIVYPENLFYPFLVLGSLGVFFLIFYPFTHFYLILLLLFQWHQDIIPAFFTISGLDIRLSDIFVLVLVAKILIEKREIALSGKIPKLILFYLLTGLFSELNAFSLFSTWDFLWTLKQYVREIEGITLFIFTLCYIKRQDDIEKLLKLFVIASLGHTIVLIIASIFSERQYFVIPRVVMVMVPAVAYLVAIITLNPKSNVYNKKLIVVLGLILFGTVLTNTRTVWNGIMGSLLFIYIIYYVLRLCRKKYKYFLTINIEAGVLYYTLYLITLGYVTAFVGNSILIYGGVGLSYMFWVILGILHALENISKRTINEVNPKAALT